MAVTPISVTAGSVAVSVTTPGGLGTRADGFTYLGTPTVTSVSPGTGPLSGGTTITVTGTGFAAGTTVSVGGVAATNVVVVSGTTMTAVTPAAGTAGARSVAVTAPGGTVTKRDAFTYGAEVLTDLFGGDDGQLPTMATSCSRR